MDKAARHYIELAHDIERLDPGYIDGYYGDPAWKGEGTRELSALPAAAEELAREVEGIAEPQRRDFLAAQVRAMQTKIRLLRGEPVPYFDEVKGLYDVEPVRVPESAFDEAIAALDSSLPGEGTLSEREQALRARFVIDRERLPALLDVIIPELRRRTLQIVELPEGEGFETQLVSNEPWSAYNWYLGEYRSRVDINTDLPTYLVGLPDTIAHEAYPGHHTEHALKEQLLWRQQGRDEHSILLINAPECVISEGIATRARRIIMDDTELMEWYRQELIPISGLRDLPMEEIFAVSKARREMRSVTNNAAMLYHQEGATEEELIAYLQRYRLATEEEARKSLSFIRHPNFRSYGFTYTMGADLLDKLFAARGNPVGWFRRLLTEPVTPTMIREWIATTDDVPESKGAVDGRNLS